jgi:hypothetical protein
MLSHMLYFYILLASFFIRKKIKSCRRRYAYKIAKKQAALQKAAHKNSAKAREKK